MSLGTEIKGLATTEKQFHHQEGAGSAVLRIYSKICPRNGDNSTGRKQGQNGPCPLTSSRRSLPLPELILTWLRPENLCIPN
jgi:hypothetical protein